MSVALESVPMLNLLLDSSKFVPVREKLLVVIARPVELPLMLLVGLPKRKLGVRILTELPLSVVLPELCMDKLPPLPLMKFVTSPKKKSGDFNIISEPLMFAFCTFMSNTSLASFMKLVAVPTLNSGLALLLANQNPSVVSLTLDLPVAIYALA